MDSSYASRDTRETETLGKGREGDGGERQGSGSRVAAEDIGVGVARQRQQPLWRAGVSEGDIEDEEQEMQQYHHYHQQQHHRINREERADTAAALGEARSVRVPSAAPTREFTTRELCDNVDVGGEPLRHGGLPRGAGDNDGRDRPPLGAAHGVGLRVSAGDRAGLRGGILAEVRPVSEVVGLAGGAGAAWGLASATGSLGSSSQRSSRRRVELRTPAEEEAVRKASEAQLKIPHT